MRNLAARTDPWAAPILLTAVIWLFSAQPDLSSGLGVLDLIGRKVLHAAGYALLCFLWWRALRTRLGARAALTGAFLMAAAYGAIDEYHQTFVAGRTGSPIDAAIDAGGAGLAVALLRRRAGRTESEGTRAARTAPAGPRA